MLISINSSKNIGLKFKGAAWDCEESRLVKPKLPDLNKKLSVKDSEELISRL